MLNSVLNNLKNLKATDVVVALKEKSKNELEHLEKRTAEEAEKALSWVVAKLVQGQGEGVTDEVRHEIVDGIMRNPKSIPHALKPFASKKLTSVEGLKDLRTSVARNLIDDAKERMAQKTSPERAGADASQPE